ncbi:hypothetical protein ACFFX0_02465 [Citricoccus parietis]|uniref:Uncharacterized protein n=1 Tax=Citricoccus parietis TaxID=592307 RepID=A0ABV5FUJ0_9MICC
MALPEIPVWSSMLAPASSRASEVIWDRTTDSVNSLEPAVSSAPSSAPALALSPPPSPPPQPVSSNAATAVRPMPPSVVLRVVAFLMSVPHFSTITG